MQNFTTSCVKLTTQNEIKIVNYPEDTGCSDEFIRKQLGNGCKYLDEVRPNRLYYAYPSKFIRVSDLIKSGIDPEDVDDVMEMLDKGHIIANGRIMSSPMIPRTFGFHYPLKPYYDGGNILMMVDDLGYDKELSVNVIASWLYGADVHGNCILGDVLFVGCTSDFEDYCGISRKDLRRLATKLYKLKMIIEG